MKPNNMSPRHHEILRCCTHLPKKILSLHGIQNLTEFVLHTLSAEQCYNLSKAAYFVDNADFDTLKGIAGYNKTEEFGDVQLMWSNPDSFSEHMFKCHFNQKVRDVNLPSARKSKKTDKKLVEELSDDLQMNNPQVYSWPIKYDNKGLLIFELRDKEDIVLDEELLHGLSLLGFCPIF